MPLDDPLDLSLADAKPLRRLANTQPSIRHGLDGFESVGFAHRHRDRCRACRRRPAPRPEAGPSDFATFEFGLNATLLNRSHKAAHGDGLYVNRQRLRPWWGGDTGPGLPRVSTPSAVGSRAKRPGQRRHCISHLADDASQCCQPSSVHRWMEIQCAEVPSA